MIDILCYVLSAFLILWSIIIVINTKETATKKLDKFALLAFVFLLLILSGALLDVAI